MASTPPDMTRFRLLLHYDGGAFHGWQLQPGVRTVQGEIEGALEELTGARRPLVASGRTDRGVHATGQVAAVDLPPEWTPRRLRLALHAKLPREIWIGEITVAPALFHPRFDAIARSYRYRIGEVEEAFSPFHRPWCWPLARDLDRDSLQRMAARLPGRHSFRRFARAGQEERGEFCVVREAMWERWEPLGVIFRITADRYLHHMVRYLVGTMVAIAAGDRGEEDFAALLDPDAHPGLRTSPPAPPEGLFLTHVEYPAEALAPGRTERRVRPPHTFDDRGPDA